MVLPRAHVSGRIMPPGWIIICLLPLLVLAGCRGENDDQDTAGHGQISRPADSGLPLDNPDSVAAFEVSEQLLTAWFLLRDYEAALQTIHPNFRESWRSLIEDTEVARTCSFIQVEGSEPDPSGMVTARYAIGGCNVIAPGGLTAVYIRTSILGSEGGPWVSQIEFLR